MYDIFYVSKDQVCEKRWTEFQKAYPFAIKLENVRTLDRIRKKSFTKMFWVVWDDILFDHSFDLNSHEATEWDDQYVHVFKNSEFYDGICMFPKDAEITQREFDHRFFVHKKEIDMVASRHQKYDIVFMSYQESFADENYEKLLGKHLSNNIYRVDGIKGIHQAHVEAAKKVSTDLFYVVDADADIVPSFQFDYQIPYYDFNAKNTVYVWRSQNAINGLIYGYGGVKLLPTKLTLNMDVSRPDMTTSISKSFKAVQQLSNITAFNTDPYNTWRSAFRECAKLSSKIIDRQKNVETIERLDVWCTVGEDKPFGKYALEGATAGKKDGEDNKSNLEALKKINDFDWLKSRYTEIYG